MILMIDFINSIREKAPTEKPAKESCGCWSWKANSNADRAKLYEARKAEIVDSLRAGGAVTISQISKKYKITHSAAAVALGKIVKDGLARVKMGQNPDKQTGRTVKLFSAVK